MERREAMRNIAFVLGGTISASTLSVLFDSCTPSGNKNASLNLSSDQEALITEIADTIVPDTSTPGAKAAGVGPFIAMMIKECYDDDSRSIFVKGLDEVEELSKSRFNGSFISLRNDDRTIVLREIADKTVKMKKEDAEEAEAEKNIGRIETNSKGNKKEKTYFFQLIRELTLLGYFTSEIGATQALVYLPVPGRYDSCVDLEAGQKAWAL